MKLMKNAMTGLLAFAGAANAATSVYIMDVSSANLSGFGPEGGAVSFTYLLQEGPELPGVGASFSQNFTWSPLSRAGNSWGGPQTLQPTRFGFQANPASITSNLPAANSAAITVPSGSEVFEIINQVFKGGEAEILGTFTIASDPAPSVTGYTVVQNEVNFGRQASTRTFTSDGVTELRTAWWAEAISEPGSYLGAQVLAEHGTSLTYEYAAMWDGIGPNPSTFTTGFGTIAAGVVAYEVIPEPSAALLSLLGGGLVWIRRSRR